jgi:DNA invertase Pin-like site-specific DNA recombinase
MSLLIGFAYGRVSSAGRGDGTSRQEQSIEIQDAEFRSYLAHIQMPEECVRFYAERGSGAFKKSDLRKRREGAKMWTAIVQARHEFPDADLHVLLTKVDRIGRGFLPTQNMHAELRALRVRLHILGLGGRSFDCDTLMGQKMVADFAFYSELEVTVTRERIKKTLDYKFERQQCLGTIPYGFDVRETGQVSGKGVKITELVENAEQLKWVLHIAGCKQRGDTSYAVAKDLNARGVPTKRAGEYRNIVTGHNADGVAIVENKLVSGEWTPGKVDKILRNNTIVAWLQKQKDGADGKV